MRPGIALDLGDVAAVVVDAMAVERERRVAEQQHVVGHPSLVPRRIPPAPPGAAARRRRRLRRVAIDDVVELGERDVRLVARGGSRGAPSRTPAGRCAPTSASTFSIVDVRVSAVADAQRRVELELAAGPHAARQRHRRQEAAALRVPVGADLRLPRAAAGSTASARARAAACPAAGRTGSRSSVADSAAYGVAVMTSADRSWRPIHVLRGSRCILLLRQSAVIFASLTSLLHFDTSPATSLPNCSGGPVTTSAPWSAMRFAVSGSASPRRSRVELRRRCPSASSPVRRSRTTARPRSPGRRSRRRSAGREQRRALLAGDRERRAACRT